MGRKSRRKAITRSQTETKGAPITACPARKGGEHCVPLNQIVIKDEDTDKTEGYAACECGRRFALSASSRRRLLGYFPDAQFIRRGIGTINGHALDQLFKSTWPRGHVSRYAKPGVVPIGTPVLHSPTQQITVITEGLVEFGSHLLTVMHEAGGIGLAANQAGVPVQALVHRFRGIAPRVLLNPEILSSAGEWDYNEGCLSLKIDGTNSSLRRPKNVVVRASTIEGKAIVILADEIFARVLQHEIDHLQGIEYVQRLAERERTRVYRIIEDNGIDLSWIPPRPYS